MSSSPLGAWQREAAHTLLQMFERREEEETVEDWLTALAPPRDFLKGEVQ